MSFSWTNSTNSQISVQSHLHFRSEFLKISDNISSTFFSIAEFFKNSDQNANAKSSRVNSVTYFLQYKLEKSWICKTMSWTDHLSFTLIIYRYILIVYTWRLFNHLRLFGNSVLIWKISILKIIKLTFSELVECRSLQESNFCWGHLLSKLLRIMLNLRLWQGRRKVRKLVGAHY